MIETPEVITTPRRDIAVIRFTIPHAEMMKSFGPGVQELMGVLAAQGIAPTGAVFAHHYRITEETFDFDAAERAADLPAGGRGAVAHPGE